MRITSRIALVAALALLVAAPAAHAAPGADVAHAAKRAKVRTLTGHVMAAPFESGRKVVIQVLVDRRSSKRAKLRAPVGVLTLKKSKKVKVARQRARIVPAFLRPGDRVRVRAKVTRAVRRGFHWTMPARAFKVTKRSPTFGPAELQTVLQAFGGDLRRLDAALTGLAKYVQAGFGKLSGDIGGLRTGLTSLSGSLVALEKRVEALEASLPALEARLKAQIDALGKDLDALETQVAALQAQLAGLSSELAALQGQVTKLQGDMAALQGQVTQLQNDMAALQAQVTKLQSDMAALQTSVTQLQTSVNALCGPGSLVDSVC